MKKTYLILPYSALKSSSTVQCCNSAQHLAYGPGIKCMGKKSYWPKGGGRWSLRTNNSRRWRASCSFTQAWSQWHRFWFFAEFNSIYLFEKTIQWCLGSSSLFLTRDDTVAPDCILSGGCNLYVHSVFRSHTSKLTILPQIKKILLPLPALWISLTLQWLFPLASLHPSSGPPIPSGLHW